MDIVYLLDKLNKKKRYVKYRRVKDSEMKQNLELNVSLTVHHELTILKIPT